MIRTLRLTSHALLILAALSLAVLPSLSGVIAGLTLGLGAVFARLVAVEIRLAEVERR